MFISTTLLPWFHFTSSTFLSTSFSGSLGRRTFIFIVSPVRRPTNFAHTHFDARSYGWMRLPDRQRSFLVLVVVSGKAVGRGWVHSHRSFLDFCTRVLRCSSPHRLCVCVHVCVSICCCYSMDGCSRKSAIASSPTTPKLKGYPSGIVHLSKRPSFIRLDQQQQQQILPAGLGEYRFETSDGDDPA